MPYVRLLALALVVLAPAVAAQPTGTCEPGSAHAEVDAGDVRATLYNTGALFYGPVSGNGEGYVVPKDSGRSPLYAAALWLGGQVSGQIRAAGGLYSTYDFWPGPLDPATGLPPDPSDCAPYDRIWIVSRDDVAAYYQTGVATADLAEWPAHLGAPVLDGDGVAGNYDLAAGDQPAITGGQTAWWLMNDAGNEHTPGGGPPLGVEVRAEAIALTHPRLQRTTLYRFAITNRSAHAIDSLYAGVFADFDLGNAADDYVGTDTTTGTAYAYNADDDDEGAAGYGVAPPASGVVVLPGAVGLPNGRDDDGDGTVDEPGERLGLTAAPVIFKSSIDPDAGEPTTALRYYRRLQGRFGGGQLMREFGDGWMESPAERPTPFYHAGDPVTDSFWSDRNTNRTGQFNSPSDRRALAATGPFRLAPGATDTVTFAVVTSFGTDHLGSVDRLRADADMVRRVHALGGFRPTLVTSQPVPPAPTPGVVRLGMPSPNPAAGTSVVRYELPAETPLRAALVDVLGRTVAVLHDGPASGAGALTIRAADLAPGVYVLHVTVPAGEAVRRVVVAR